MIISHKHRFVIFSPWKTASSTMNLRLEEYNESRYNRFYDFNKYLNRVVHQHITCAEFNCLPESRLGYFLASFVRNPYDRVYSGFRQLQKDIKEQPIVTFADGWIKELVMKQLSDNFSQLCKAEFDFDNWVKLVDEHQIYEVGRNTSFPLYPSHYWTHISGIQRVDFVGFVETFEKDFDLLCSKIGIAGLQRVNSNVDTQVSEQNVGKSTYKYIQLMKRSSIEKINYLFKEDFALFEYEMM